MSDDLEQSLRELALRVTRVALGKEAAQVEDHKLMLDTLKAAGGFLISMKRVNRGEEPDEDENSMAGIQKRIKQAEVMQ
jgi:hypothetical protein